MRRKAGTLVPLELAIVMAAVELLKDGIGHFHGYELAKHLAAVSDSRLLTAYGTLYRALARLEGMGLVRSRWEDPHIAARENRPGRRLYELTPAGETATRQQAPASIPARAQKLARRRLKPA